MNAKDILGLPKTSFPAQEKKPQPHKESQRKPDGISREVTFYSLFSLKNLPIIPFTFMHHRVQLILVSFWAFLNLQVFALTGGLAPLMPAVDSSQLKKRPPSDEKVPFFFFKYFFQYQSCFLFFFHRLIICWVFGQGYSTVALLSLIQIGV